MPEKPIREVLCPGCGKDLHTFHVPARPGLYRLRCQADRDRPVNLRVFPDGKIKREK